MHTRARQKNSNSRAILRLGSPHTARTLKPRDSPQPNYSQQDKPQNSQSQSPNARYVCFARASARVRFKFFTPVCASVQVRNTSRANFSGHSSSSDEEDAPAPESAPRYLQESARHKTSQESGNVTADGMGTGGSSRRTRFSAAQIRLTTLATQEKRGHRRCRRQKAARRLRLQARWRRRWLRSLRRNACWPAREPAVAFCQGSMHLAQVVQASRASRHLAPEHALASGHAPLERGLGDRLSQALVAAPGGSS